MANTLTVTVTQNIDNSEGGFEYNYTTTETFDNCDAYTATRQEFVHDAWTQFAKFSTTLGMGIFKEAKVRYMRFANLHATRFVTIMLSDSTANKQVTYKLQAGQVAYFTAIMGEGFLFNCTGSTTAATADVVQGTPALSAMDDGSSVAATADEVLVRADTGSVSLDTLIVYDL